MYKNNSILFRKKCTSLSFRGSPSSFFRDLLEKDEAESFASGTCTSWQVLLILQSSVSQDPTISAEQVCLCGHIHPRQRSFAISFSGKWRRKTNKDLYKFPSHETQNSVNSTFWHYAIRCVFTKWNRTVTLWSS